MKKKLISYAAVALVLTACSSEEPITPPNQVNDAMGANPYRVSLTDALKNADALLGELGEDEVTRSIERKVESVEYYSRPGTRSLGGDTLLYLVNYADDAGFALLSADSRLRPIYAISDEGSMSFSDTTYNKGLALFARGVEIDVDNTIRSIIDRPGVIDTIIPFKRVVREVAPLLNYYQSRWSQGYPYNQYCFTNDGSPAYVGCAAVAVGMIMSYYKHPKSYSGYTFDWNAMNSGQNNENIARLLHLLGDNNNLQMDYGAIEDREGSGAYPSRYYPTFTNMNYSGHNQLQTFSEEDVCELLDNSQGNILVQTGPVIMCGYGYDENDEIVGHGWVVDGYVQYEVTPPLIGQGYVLDDVLFHCVWGWGGSCNGYFYWAKTNSFGGLPNETGSNDDYHDTGIVFDTYIQYMGGFRKVYLFNPNL